MKAEEKVLGLLQPQKFAGEYYGGLTADEIANSTGLKVNSVRVILKRLQAVGKAAKWVGIGSYESKNWWYSELWKPEEPEAPVQAELPPPNFNPPTAKAVEEAPSDTWVRCHRPMSSYRHQRSAKNRHITRCGVRISANYRAANAEDMKCSVCPGCARSIATQQVHQHQWYSLPIWTHELCTVKGCKAKREKKAVEA